MRAKSADLNPVLVREAGEGDIEGILDALEPEEFIKPLTREHLRSLFTYEWTKPDAIRNYGIILVDDQGVHGYEGMVYSPPRTLGGCDAYVTANLTTAFVQRAYRTRRTAGGVVRYSIEMIRAAMAQGCMVTVFSARGPNDVVPTLLTGLGFEQLCSADLFYPCSAALRSSFRFSGSITSSPREVRNQLNLEQLKIVEDHEKYGCRFYLVRQGDRRCFIVTKRRYYRTEWIWPSMPIAKFRRRKLPVSDVLHISEPALALECWGRLVASVCLKERVVGMACSASFIESAPPGSTEIPQRIFVYRRECPARSVDKLYSELVLLP